MKNFFKLLLAALTLLCTTNASALVEYNSWNSDNHQAGSSQSKTWRINLKTGEVLAFHYYYWSDYDGDRFVISINEQNIIDEDDGYTDGNYVYTATENLSLKIVATFTKGYGGTDDDEYAQIYNMRVFTSEDLYQTKDVGQFIVGQQYSLSNDYYNLTGGFDAYDANWTSSDESVATVNSDGRITAKAIGTATITATDKSGTGITVVYTIHVVDVLEVAGGLQLKDPYYNYGNVSFSSDDESVAIVSNRGYVIGLSEGTTTITRTYNGSTQTYPIRVTRIGVDISGSMSLGDIFYKSIGVYADSWTSADESIAKVTNYGSYYNKGTVYGFALGSTTITATGTKDGKEVSMAFPVNVTKVGIDISGSGSLSNAFYYLTGKSCGWTSDNEQIARVTNGTFQYYVYNTDWSFDSNAGTIYGFSEGSTTITATATDGSGVSIVFPVNITKPGITINTCSSEIISLFKALTGKSATFTSADENVAIIGEFDNNRGKTVFGLSEGSTTITATATDGSGVSIAFPVNITNPYIQCTDEAPGFAEYCEDFKVYRSPDSYWEKSPTGYWNENGYYDYGYVIQSAYEDLDEDGYVTNKISGDLIYKFTIPENHYIELYPSLCGEMDSDSGGESYVYAYVDENERYEYNTNWSSSNDNYNPYLSPGSHFIRVYSFVRGKGEAGLLGFNNTYYSEKDYDTASQGIAVDTIRLSREGILGGEALKIHNNLSEFRGLYVSGPFDEYDWKSLSEMTNLQVLDMTGVEANAYPTTAQNDKLRVVRFSKHIPSINNPFQKVDYVYVPDEVTEIKSMTSSSDILSIEGCQGVKEIGNEAFKKTNLPGEVCFPHVENIGASAFVNSGNWLHKVEMPNAKYIGKSAFAGTALTKINYPMVEVVDEQAFKGCPLTSVKLPNAKSIKNAAFVGGELYRTQEWNGSGYSWSYGFNRGKNAGMIEDIDITLAENIGDWAFAGNFELAHVKAENLKTIGEYAFGGCCNLGTIDLHKAESLGYRAFYMFDYYRVSGSYGYSYRGGILDGIDLSSVTNMGDEAFYRCEKLKSVDISNITIVPTGAFRACTSLQSVDLRRATTIRSSAFYGCSALKSVNLSKAETIDGEAFYGCGLLEINLPSVTSLGNSAFANNSKATSIDLSDKLTSLGENAFYGCTAVKELTLPASLTELPSNCFSGSNNIKTINVNAPAPPAVGETPFTMQTLYTATLNVPSASLGLYQAHDYWKHFYYWGENPAALTDLVLATDLNLGTVRMDKARLTINPGISVSMTGTEAQDFRSVLMKANGTQSGMFLSGCERVTSDETSVELSMTGLKWYFVCLPFDITIADIQNSEGAQLAIYTYDGARRAANGTGSSWTRQRSGQLSRGQGFIVQASKATTLTLSATYETKDTPFLPYDVTLALEENASSTAANQGWNFLGNPYPTYFDIAKLGFTAPITVWTGSTYTAYSPEDDDFALAPMQPFFVQCPNGVESLTLNADGRQTTSVISHPSEVKAQQPKANGRKVVDIVLTDGQQTDRTRIVCNALATDGYDLSCDAAKMMSMEADVPQFYTHRNGVEYAINEGPQEGGDVELGLLLPKTGTYTLRLQRADMRAMLTDLLTGETFELTADGYTFEAEAGTCDDRFVLTLLTDEETAVEDIESEMVNGKWSNGEWYDLSGRRFNKASRGVNIVRQGTNVTKQLSR